MLPDFIDKRRIPNKPGIYFFKNTSGEIIYVGKAIDLKKRVSSYFNKTPEALSVKLTRLVAQINDVETIIVESELEALILEANLIKKHLPLFNSRLTDDKDYLYISVTQGDFSTIRTSRKQDLYQVKKYFGPFPSSRVVKQTLKSLRKIFPWCANPPKPNQVNKRPCFYRHLNLCPGPCEGAITKQEYSKTLNCLIMLLEGKKELLIKELEKEMQSFAKKQEYEKAERIKQTIAGVFYLTQSNRTAFYLDNSNFLEQESKLALEQLQNHLKLPNIPVRIEAYDISNIQGTDATGSMVVFTNGEVDKSQYRRFKIKISGQPNDYAMHEEMMERRLAHQEWSLPNLVIIDGGRGQVRASYRQLTKNNLKLPIFGLAKRLEWLYPPEGEVIKLPKSSLVLRLLQRIRDEAHRFAISYHKYLRKKSFGLN